MVFKRSSDYKCLKLAVAIGISLQTSHPDIASKFANEGARRIAKGLLEEGFSLNGTGKITSLAILENAVKYSLKGNSAKELGQTYEGLIDKDNYRHYAEKHREEAGYACGQDALARGVGIHALSKTDLSVNGAKAAIARGQVPWSNCERLVAMGHLTSHTLTETGEYLNSRFHDGLPIRNKVRVHEMGRRFKRQVAA